MSWLDSITDSMGVNLSKPREIVKDKETWHAAVHGATESQTRLSAWKQKQPHKIHDGREHPMQHQELYLRHWSDQIRKEVRKGGVIRTCMADSFHWAAETNTAL